MHAPKKLRSLLPALLVALCLGAAAQPAAASEQSPFGINIHIPQGAELTSILDRVQAAGIGWVRIDFVWAAVETSPDHFEWGAYDALVAAARARGLEVFASLAYTPAWATIGPELTGVPSQGADWADFCRRAALRYRGTIRYWGLWNEPNLDRFWSGSRQQYIDLILKNGADAIHDAVPEAKVGGPDLAHLTSGDSDWFDWLRESILQAGDRLDFVTHHVYDGDGHGDLAKKLNDSTLFGDRPSFWNATPPSVREVLVNAGWFGRPFWLTETGWESDEVGEARQATYYSGFLNDWFTGRSGREWIGKVFFYEIKDGSAPDSPSWGILHPNNSLKPAYGAYRDFIAANQPSLDDALAVGNTIPGSMETGQTLEVRVTLRNTGTTPWTRAAGYALGAVDDSDPFASVRQLLEPGESVAPGQQKTFVIQAKAPNAAGTYRTDWQMLREGDGWFGPAVSGTVTVTAAPSIASRTLDLLGNRFAVEVTWRDQHAAGAAGGRAGFGRALRGSDQTGFFWFFDPSNVELVVKMLDGSTLNGHRWVFYGALSDVEYWIKVTDRQTGQIRQYHNDPGNLCGRGDTSAFRAPAASSAAGAASAAPGADFVPLSFLDLEENAPAPLFTTAPAGSCVPGSQDLCLLGSRFRVQVEWRDQHNGGTGLGTAVPSSDQTGFFWFFDAANTELVVKMLDGRTLSGKYWVFYGALSDVEYWITVTDTVTGARKRYHNAPGNLCGRGDTQAL